MLKIACAVGDLIMGQARNEQTEAECRGYWQLDTYVCSDCVSDDYLKRLVAEHMTSKKCSYCQDECSHPIAADANIIAKTIYETVGLYYQEFDASGTPHSAETRPDTIDLSEAINEIQKHAKCDMHQDFVNDLIENATVQEGYVATANGSWQDMHEHEEMISGWDSFASVVKHETRFFFNQLTSAYGNQPFDFSISGVFSELESYIRGLIGIVPKNTIVYRARIRRLNDNWHPTPDQLGAPPMGVATAGRMNPVGISYLYTSFESETALAEVMDNCTCVHIAQFELSEDIEAVDFTKLGHIPSIFDCQQYEDRENLLFLHEFSKSISKRKQESEIEYIPTQILSEYIAQVFQTKTGKNPAGIIFSSSVHPKGKNLVVFPSRSFEKSFHGVEFVRDQKITIFPVP